MSQQPYEPRGHGGPPPLGSPPSTRAPAPRPPATPDLRLLLRLTVASFAVGVLGSAVGLLAATEQYTGPAAGPAFGTIVLALSLLFGVGVPAGLYALVYFPLREQRLWAWILGIVLASMALLSTLANTALVLAGPFDASPGLATGALKAVVDVAWLVVAARPGVRAVLR